MRFVRLKAVAAATCMSVVAVAEDIPWPDDCVWCTVTMREARDLNGDGVRDVVGFGSCDMDTETGPGVIRVESGADGSLLAQFMTPDGPFVLDFLCLDNPADLNDDQTVTLEDFFGLLSQVGQQGPLHIPGDVDGDGMVTQTDVTLLLQALATTYWSAWVDVLNTLIETHPEYVIETDASLLPGRPCLQPFGDFYYCGGGGGGDPGGPGGNGSGEGGQGNPGGGGGSSMPGGSGPPRNNGGGSGGGSAPCCEWDVNIIAPTAHIENGVYVYDPAANYMPVYGRVSFTVNWTLLTPGCRTLWWTCCPNGTTDTAGWRWIAGQNLIKPGGSPWAFESNGTPGTITVQYWYRPCTGGMVSDQHTVTIVQHPPLTLRHMAYIPCQAVENPGYVPGLPLGYPYYAGDNRGPSFGAGSLVAYRACLDLVFRVSNFPGVTGAFIVPQTTLPPFGLTTAYDSGAAAPLCSTLLPTSLIVATATLGLTPSNHRITWTRVSPTAVALQFYIAASNPLNPAPCEIDLQATIVVTQHVDPVTGTPSSSYIATGAHDLFPAHELYLSGHGVTHAIHTYNPALPTTALDLCLPARVHMTTNGAASGAPLTGSIP